MSVSDEGGIDGFVEMLLLIGILANEAGHEMRAVAIAECHGLVEIVHQGQADLGGLLPFPFVAQFGFVQYFGLELTHVAPGAQDADFAFEEFRRQGCAVALHYVELVGLVQGFSCAFQGTEQHGHQFMGPGPGNAAGIEGVADLSVQGANDRFAEGFGPG